MMLHVAFSTLILIALTLVQTTWLAPIAIFGARPDLGLLAMVWMAYRNGPVVGVSSGFISGLVDDVMSAAPLGFSAFIKSLLSWAASFLHGSIELDRVLMPMLLGAASTLAKAGASLFLGLMFKTSVETYDLLGRRFWVEVAYNALLAPLLFLLLGLLFRLIDGERKRE